MIIAAPAAALRSGRPRSLWDEGCGAAPRPELGGLGQGVLPALTEGVHTAGGSALVISRGLGNSTFPLRLFNRPEVVALTLRAE